MRCEEEGSNHRESIALKSTVTQTVGGKCILRHLPDFWPFPDSAVPVAALSAQSSPLQRGRFSEPSHNVSVFWLHCSTSGLGRHLPPSCWLNVFVANCRPMWGTSKSYSQLQPCFWCNKSILCALWRDSVLQNILADSRIHDFIHNGRLAAPDHHTKASISFTFDSQSENT